MNIIPAQYLRELSFHLYKALFETIIRQSRNQYSYTQRKAGLNTPRINAKSI